MNKHVRRLKDLQCSIIRAVRMWERYYIFGQLLAVNLLLA